MCFLFFKNSSNKYSETSKTLKDAISKKEVDFYNRDHFIKCKKYNGTIWKAKFEELNITVALKSLNHHRNLDDTFVDKQNTKRNTKRNTKQDIEQENKQITEQEKKQITEQENKQITEQEKKQITEQEKKQITEQEKKQITEQEKKLDVYHFGEILSKIFRGSLESKLLDECIELCNKCMDKKDQNQQPTIKKVYEDLMQLED
ncbi:2029_t:CDS:2, partial [Cetraspora pellucida]